MHNTVGIFEELKGVYLFNGLTEEQTETLLEHATDQELQHGETLFSHGDPSERFFWLRRGLIKLTRLSADGEEKVVELIRAGQVFGEAIAFMERQEYPVNAEAIEPSEVVGFENRRFLNLLRTSPDSCFRLLADLSMRLHSQINEIDRLTLHNATARVIGYLLDQPRDGDRILLGSPKHLLASRLSIQPETLSRIFSRLNRDGLIKVEGQTICLRDAEELRRFFERQ